MLKFTRPWWICRAAGVDILTLGQIFAAHAEPFERPRGSSLRTSSIDTGMGAGLGISGVRIRPLGAIRATRAEQALERNNAASNNASLASAARGL